MYKRSKKTVTRNPTRNPTRNGGLTTREVKCLLTWHGNLHRHQLQSRELQERSKLSHVRLSNDAVAEMRLQSNDLLQTLLLGALKEAMRTSSTTLTPCYLFNAFEDKQSSFRFNSILPPQGALSEQRVNPDLFSVSLDPNEHPWE